jgi:tetratricopeptide (TPR) repeat protein
MRAMVMAEKAVLTLERQRGLYLREYMLQMFEAGIISIKSEKTGEILSISPETAQWAIPYSRRIASAREYFFKKNFKAALEAYHKILKELPDAAIILNDLGVCHGEMGNNELAYTYFKKSLAYAPEEKKMKSCQIYCN